MEELRKSGAIGTTQNKQNLTTNFTKAMQALPTGHVGIFGETTRLNDGRELQFFANLQNIIQVLDKNSGATATICTIDEFKTQDGNEKNISRTLNNALAQLNEKEDILSEDRLRCIATGSLYMTQDRRGRGSGVLWYHRAFLASEQARDKFIGALREFLDYSPSHHSPYIQLSAYKQLLETLEEVQQLTGTTDYNEEIDILRREKDTYEESVIEPLRIEAERDYRRMMRHKFVS